MHTYIHKSKNKVLIKWHKVLNAVVDELSIHKLKKRTTH